jgi:hypothetical protein
MALVALMEEVKVEEAHTVQQNRSKSGRGQRRTSTMGLLHSPSCNRRHSQTVAQGTGRYSVSVFEVLLIVVRRRRRPEEKPSSRAIRSEARRNTFAGVGQRSKKDGRNQPLCESGVLTNFSLGVPLGPDEAVPTSAVWGRGPTSASGPPRENLRTCLVSSGER